MFHYPRALPQTMGVVFHLFKKFELLLQIFSVSSLWIMTMPILFLISTYSWIEFFPPSPYAFNPLGLCYSSQLSCWFDLEAHGLNPFVRTYLKFQVLVIFFIFPWRYWSWSFCLFLLEALGHGFFICSFLNFFVLVLLLVSLSCFARLILKLLILDLLFELWSFWSCSSYLFLLQASSLGPLTHSF